MLYRTDLENNLSVCPKCNSSRTACRRASALELLLDAEGRFEIGSEVVPVDPLKFKDEKNYPDRLAAGAQENRRDRRAGGRCRARSRALPSWSPAFEFDFMGGSMGSVVGERFVRGVHVAYENRIPFICITATGGARMQEGLFSLMQMAKTTAG